MEPLSCHPLIELCKPEIFKFLILHDSRYTLRGACL